MGSTHDKRGLERPMRVQGAERGEPAGARILRRYVLDLELKIAKRPAGADLVGVALDRRVGVDADSGAIEPNSAETERRCDVHVGRVAGDRLACRPVVE